MKRFALILGLLALALIWGGPLLSIWRESFAAHMTAHMGVVAVAAPLIAIGAAPSVMRRSKNSHTAGPILASIFDLIIVWGWHAPALRELAQASVIVTFVEQASFLLAGLFLWLSCLAAGEEASRRQAAAGAFGLLFTSVHMTLLGALLSLSPRVLYGAGEVTCFGLVLDSASDQALGGVLMLLIGGAVYLAGGIALLSRVIRDGEATA